MLTLNILMLMVTLLIGIPVLWFCIQVMCSLLPARATTLRTTSEPVRTVVLVPAHNESHHLIPTLKALLREKCDFIRVLVVADNCTDNTAEVAKTEGAEVIERTNKSLRGKGYALDFGIQFLQNNPPEVLVVMDADCLPEPGLVQTIGRRALASNRPIQALYLMGNNNSPALKEKIAEFAWLVKNQIRPRGLQRIGLPCQLTGSGMAFPWRVLQKVSLATGHIVEDMKLGIELTELGHPPLFSEHTLVRSHFPSQKDGVLSQRTRWEHGHLSMLFNEGLPKLTKGFLSRDWTLFAMAMDLCIPPLALLVLATFIWAGFSGIYWLTANNHIPFLMSVSYLLLIASTVVLAWLKFGRHVVSGLDLLKTPWYVMCKLPIYTSYLFRRQVQWVRAKRDNETQ